MALPGSERQGRSEKHRNTQREQREAGGLEGNLLAIWGGGGVLAARPASGQRKFEPGTCPCICQGRRTEKQLFCPQSGVNSSPLPKLYCIASVHFEAEQI